MQLCVFTCLKTLFCSFFAKWTTSCEKDLPHYKTCYCIEPVKIERDDLGC